MTKLLEEAMAAISRLPPETQDDLARLMLALAEDAPTPLTADESSAIAEADAEGRARRTRASGDDRGLLACAWLMKVIYAPRALRDLRVSARICLNAVQLALAMYSLRSDPLLTP